MRPDSNDNMESSSEKPRLWVVSELYYPEMTSTGYYLTKIAEGLTDEFEVAAICGQPNYSARGTIAPKRETFKKVDIRRVLGTRFDKNFIPLRVLNMVTLSISVFLRCLFDFRKGDRVLVVTTPPLLPFLTGVACRMRGARHILLIHDCYPEILYAAGKLNEGSLVSRFLERLSGRLLRNADRIVVVGRDMLERIREKAGNETPCFVIPNWAELESVSPAPRAGNELLLTEGLEEKVVLLYAGNMGYPNDIDTIIEAAASIEGVEDSIHFIFLGAGVKRSHLVKAVNDKKLTNITILDSRPRSEQQVFLNACDVGIVSLVGKMKGVSMPSRTYNILAAGKPILALCDPESEIARVVEEEEVGWIIEPGDSVSLVEVLFDIARADEKLLGFGKNARRAAVEKYSIEMAIEAYHRVLSG